MRVPFGTISIAGETKGLINKILDSKRVSCGKYVAEFERKFARLVNAKAAVGVSSGTDADILALASLYDFGAKRQDEVILPALSFVATGNAVLHAGFKPVFVDIVKETLNINPDLIEKKITKRTRAIMAVHLMGKPAKMEIINKIAKKHNLYVIEDAAQAHGAVYKGKNVGEWSDMAAYSLYIAHVITTVEGGIITTNNEELAGILRSLRAHGRACKCSSCIVNTASQYCDKRFKYGRDIRFIFERIGYSSKMNELEAAVGLGGLAVYRQIIHKRHRNLITMIKRLSEFSKYLFTIQEERGERIGPHAFPIIVRENAPFGRDELACFLERHNIESRDLFSSIPTQCRGFSYLGFKPGDFPNAEYVGNHGIHIGVHQDITEEHIDYIFKVLESFINAKVNLK